MIGWHMRCYLRQFPALDTLAADRSTFSDKAKLVEFASGLNVIIHFAGQNRGPNDEIRETNPRLSLQLIEACDEADVRPHIVYASTTHIESASAYGQSKQQAGDILHSWADDRKSKFTNLILPHVFGEGSRPFYNSAVATFAHQLAVGEDPRVINDTQLELIHAQDVCARILKIIESGNCGDQRLRGQKISVSAVLAKLRQLAASYAADIVPDVRDAFDLSLFNLYRSYLFPAEYPRQLKVNADDRGYLVEAVKNLSGGQAFFSTTKPGITRGNHYHYRKVERFLVVQGQATIRIRRLFDDTVHSFDVTGDQPAYVDMPPLHTHNISNAGDTDLLTLFWAHEIYDPQQPDTIHETV